LATSNIPKLRLGLGRELLYKYSYLYKIFKMFTSNSMKCNQCSHRLANGRQCRRTASCKLGCKQQCWQHSSQWRGPGICRSTVNCDAQYAYTYGNGVTTRPSQIAGAGQGLFVTKQVLKGDAITEYDGHLISDAEARIRMQRGEDTHFMSMRDGSGLVISGLKQPVVGRGAASFINDPRGSRFKPNAVRCLTDRVLRDAAPDTRTGARTTGRVWLRATRTLRPGEEVFFEYGNDYWRRHRGR
jgi:hypothetical protein